jgi:D-arginine utilization repressor
VCRPEAPRDIELVAAGIATLFEPYVEVTLHDLRSHRIVAIWNPISGRRAGDDSLIEDDFVPTLGDEAVIGPYAQVDVRGHRTSSVSVPVAEGRLLMCINFDRSVLDGVVSALSAFAVAKQPQPRELFSQDWRARINELIADWCRERNLVARDLDRAGRKALIDHLERVGVFDTRHAATHVSAALGISRASLYSMRKEKN